MPYEADKKVQIDVLILNVMIVERPREGLGQNMFFTSVGSRASETPYLHSILSRQFQKNLDTYFISIWWSGKRIVHVIFIYPIP
jgi:hypothetical protein